MLKGTAYIGDKEFEGKAHHTLTFSEDGAETIKIQTRDEDAHFVLIAGEPLREPIVQHGPFVMNTGGEIYETFVDYQNGQNGFERIPPGCLPRRKFRFESLRPHKQCSSLDVDLGVVNPKCDPKTK
ncbi:hypothetical protein BGZ65_007439 [Modicella reniformis]|uniref:Pirin C-terminal domain-containing protein n=1 Tax=Modicella reniformis TaxID=1440133 RepID=A0A9P6LS72_9FUNG|nr:hypothetical protein BGZ65_007439 [Modicella reniformis]